MKRIYVVIIATLVMLNISAVPVSAAIQATKVEIRGAVANEKEIPGGLNLSTLPVSWTPQTFAGFYYDLKDNLGKEELVISSTDKDNRPVILNSRSRNIPEGALIYKTQGQGKTLKVVGDGFNGNFSNAKAAGLEKFDTESAGVIKKGQYLVVGWQSEKYVGINGKIDRLTKLLFEHGIAATEKKTLIIGETWNMGEGWALTANAIDAKTSPRQIWFTLSKDGTKKDEKTIQQGGIYTYIEKSLANESDVPLFVTFIDSVFAGTTSDVAQLRFTWLVSGNVTNINTGDKFGIFEVKEINDAVKTIIMNNKDVTVDLSQNSEPLLMGNIKFRVADKADVLRFFPKVDYDIQSLVSTIPVTAQTTSANATSRTASTPLQSVSETETKKAVQTTTQTKSTSPAQKVPSFETILAIAGLFAVVYIVRRKNK